MNNEEMIKILIIKSPYHCVDKSKLPVVAMALRYDEGGEVFYNVDADFLPAIDKKGISPGCWPFREEEVEVL